MVEANGPKTPDNESDMDVDEEYEEQVFAQIVEQDHVNLEQQLPVNG